MMRPQSPDSPLTPPPEYIHPGEMMPPASLLRTWTRERSPDCWLAEANVPYDLLYEMEQINPYFADADVALVVDANDVTNPAAKNNKSSPLHGMPILEVEWARSIIVLKRSQRSGCSGRACTPGVLPA